MLTEVKQGLQRLGRSQTPNLELNLSVRHAIVTAGLLDTTNIPHTRTSKWEQPKAIAGIPTMDPKVSLKELALPTLNTR